jgi:hypothetical protein
MPPINEVRWRDIVAVWQAGIRADRETYRESIEKQAVD